MRAQTAGRIGFHTATGKGSLTQLLCQALRIIRRNKAQQKHRPAAKLSSAGS